MTTAHRRRRSIHNIEASLQRALGKTYGLAFDQMDDDTVRELERLAQDVSALAARKPFAGPPHR